MSSNINTKRLHDQLDLYKRANDKQVETIEALRRKNAALERQVKILKGYKA